MSASAPNALLGAVRTLTTGAQLKPEDLTAAFDVILRGDGTPVQISALLVGLRVKGETPEELAAVVRALRNAMVRLPADRPEELVDTCGTGGGTIQTFNISTAAALLVAGAGVRVAKHGNRSFTTKCGSADVLEALGVGLDVSPQVMANALADAGIVFMFAPLMHPAMRHVGPVRGELGVQTVMNMVGPLANPAGAGRQVVGVADARRLSLIAGALADLGSKHALIVHGAGMDEVSPFGTTEVVEIRDGTTTTWTIEPTKFGYGSGSAEDMGGGTPAENSEAILRVLRGEANVASTAAVVLNAAAAFYVSGQVPDFGAGVDAAREAVKSGAGLIALDRLKRAFTK